MKLDFSSLEKAIAQLEEALGYYHSPLVKVDVRLALHLRAATTHCLTKNLTFD